MKSLLILTAFSLFSLGVSAQVINRTFIDVKGNRHLHGQVNPKKLWTKPYKKWFKPSYKTTEVHLEKLEGIPKPDSITIFLGTWCGDSKREVPAFMKITSEWGVPTNKINVIAVGRELQTYKQTPEHYEAGLNIHRVPTFIFHDKDGNEINRIVESPVVTLEDDIIHIMTADYEPQYKVVTDLDKMFATDFFPYSQDINNLTEKYRHITKNKQELNTYGYVLLTSFQLPQARLVFQLNVALYPEEASTHKSLAMITKIMGDIKTAQTCMEKAIALAPENKRYQAELDDLKAMMQLR
ncbi:MAG: thioredoxin family protein [Cyclobacteriaceae bacterium]|nr:thioredoxin family protein [Cyclobacteriaceae bacterium HetDA_MAG_MS6]